MSLHHFHPKYIYIYIYIYIHVYMINLFFSSTIGHIECENHHPSTATAGGADGKSSVFPRRCGGRRAAAGGGHFGGGRGLRQLWHGRKWRG